MTPLYVWRNRGGETMGEIVGLMVRVSLYHLLGGLVKIVKGA